MKYITKLINYSANPDGTYRYGVQKIIDKARHICINKHGVYFIPNANHHKVIGVTRKFKVTLKWYPGLLSKLQANTIPEFEVFDRTYRGWPVLMSLHMAVRLLEVGLPMGMHDAIYVSQFKTYSSDGLAKYTIENDRTSKIALHNYSYGIKYQIKYHLIKGEGREIIIKV